MKYFLHIGYKGTHYHGWQRQPDVHSIQAELETTLSRMLNKTVICIGCGRTDAGVHASQFFAHIILEKEWDFDPVFRLNKMLPDDIALFEAISVERKAQAQFDATLRTYDYFIHFSKDPFLSELSTLYPLKKPDLDKMKKACQLLTRYKDFRSFCRTPDKYDHTLCELQSARLFTTKNGLRLQFTSNRFLRGMVRLLVAKLMDIGTGQMSLDELEDHLLHQHELRFKKTAYPQGLYLSKVAYPFLNAQIRSSFFTVFQRDWKEVSD